MADTKIISEGKEIVLTDIGFEPGADPYSQEAVCENFFWGWTANTPWGEITWRIVHPNDFPKEDVWNGQLMLGGAFVAIDGRSYRLDAVASQVDGKWVIKAAAENTKMPWWLFPMQSSVTEKELASAQEIVRPALENACEAVIAVADHNHALLWASAYAWALQNTRRSFNMLFNSHNQEAIERGEVREEIEAALFKAEWDRSEILAMVKHPRKEIRALGSRIVLKLQDDRAAAARAEACPGKEEGVEEIVKNDQVPTAPKPNGGLGR